jgi:hypothetical protein
MGVIHHHIDAIGALAGTAGEVDEHRTFIGVDGHRCLQGDHIAAGHIERALAVIGAGLELANGLTRRVLGAVDHLI